MVSTAEAELLSSPIFELQGRKYSSPNPRRTWPEAMSVHCGNITAAGIANDTVKKQQYCSMEMQIFWITDQVKLGRFDVQYHPGQYNWPVLLQAFLW